MLIKTAKVAKHKTKIVMAQTTEIVKNPANKIPEARPSKASRRGLRFKSLIDLVN